MIGATANQPAMTCGRISVHDLVSSHAKSRLALETSLWFSVAPGEEDPGLVPTETALACRRLRRGERDLRDDTRELYTNQVEGKNACLIRRALRSLGLTLSTKTSRESGLVNDQPSSRLSFAQANMSRNSRVKVLAGQLYDSLLLTKNTVALSCNGGLSSSKSR